MNPLTSYPADRETARQSRPVESFTDFQLMLELWNAGGAASRDVALEIADQNRNRATRTTTGAPL
jgi:hypothetical protein